MDCDGKNRYYKSDGSNKVQVDQCRKEFAEERTEVLRQKRKNMFLEVIENDKRKLAEVGLSPDDVALAVERKDISILQGNKTAERYYYLDVYGAKDCFKSMPQEIKKIAFAYSFFEEMWTATCEYKKKNGEDW